MSSSVEQTEWQQMQRQCEDPVRPQAADAQPWPWHTSWGWWGAHSSLLVCLTAVRAVARLKWGHPGASPEPGRGASLWRLTMYPAPCIWWRGADFLASFIFSPYFRFVSVNCPLFASVPTTQSKLVCSQRGIIDSSKQKSAENKASLCLGSGPWRQAPFLNWLSPQGPSRVISGHLHQPTLRSILIGQLWVTCQAPSQSVLLESGD